MAALNESVLAEELGSVDLRDIVSIEDLRRILVHAVETYLEAHPQAADRPGFEPFYFCEAIEITVPLESAASTLAELAEGIRKLSLQTLHYHFINSRLRLHLETNDFSLWIEDGLGLPALAQQLNHIDCYTYTLEGIRSEILRTMEPWMTQ